MSDRARRPFDPDALTRRRAAAGLSLTQLTDRSGLSYGYLWRLENGDHPRPTAVTLHKLAVALGCDTDDLTHSATEEHAA